MVVVVVNGRMFLETSCSTLEVRKLIRSYLENLGTPDQAVEGRSMVHRSNPAEEERENRERMFYFLDGI